MARADEADPLAPVRSRTQRATIDGSAVGAEEPARRIARGASPRAAAGGSRGGRADRRRGCRRLRHEHQLVEVERFALPRGRAPRARGAARRGRRCRSRRARGRRAPPPGTRQPRASGPPSAWRATSLATRSHAERTSLSKRSVSSRRRSSRSASPSPADDTAARKPKREDEARREPHGRLPLRARVASPRSMPPDGRGGEHDVGHSRPLHANLAEDAEPHRPGERARGGAVEEARRVGGDVRDGRRIVRGREADERPQRRRRERTRDVEQEREGACACGAATISAPGTGRAVTS